jgi:energy-coupling factor transporter ATP-binding protein EcfA2
MKKLILLSGPRASGKSHIIEALQIIANGKSKIHILEEIKDINSLWEQFSNSSNLWPNYIHIFSTQLDVFNHDVPKHLKPYVHIINCRNITSVKDTCEPCVEKIDVNHLYRCIEQQRGAIEMLHKLIEEQKKQIAKP